MDEYELPIPMEWIPYDELGFHKGAKVRGYRRFNHKLNVMPVGKILRIETPVPAVVYWSVYGWATVQNVETRDTRLGVHVSNLPTGELAGGTTIISIFHWLCDNRREETDFTVVIKS